MARHLTYANVVATLALFIALGGGAYAATKLPRNSVTTIQVKNGTLIAKDFKKGQLKTGKTGPIGPAGPRGLDGVAGPQGIQGLKGDTGADGSAKAYAYVTTQGNVVAGAKGISASNITVHTFGEYCIDGLAFTPTAAFVQPDVLSGDSNLHAEVQVPSDNTGGCDAAQIYIRISSQSVSGGNLTSTGTPHGFYIEIN